MKYNQELFDAFFEQLIADTDRVIAAQKDFPATLPPIGEPSHSGGGSHEPVGWVGEDGGFIPAEGREDA